MGRPLARTRVILQPVQGSSGIPVQRTLTNSTGQFWYTRLPAGAYSLRAERSGYAPLEFGQRKWNGPGTPIVLGPDGKFAAELRLAKLGVITGYVTDQNRVGIPSYRVLVYRDGRPLTLTANGVTDDRGAYRVAGLEPGRYHVRSGPHELEDGAALLPTYFGQTASAAQSQAVEVRLDEETTEVNITPLPGKLFRLTGRLALAGVSSVALYSDLGKSSTSPDYSGNFSFDQLAPGHYELLAESKAGPTPQVCYRRFWLDGDMEGLVLEPSRAPSVSVRCEVEGSTASAVKDLAIFFRRTAPLGETGTRRMRCPQAEFLSPGAWEAVVVSPPSHYIVSLSTDRGPLDGDEFTLEPAEQAGLRVVLSARPAGLQGKVLAGEGHPAIGAVVLLNPVDAALRPRIHGKNVARADANGEYRFEGLPPGEYQLVASFEIQDPADIDWRTQPSTTVQLDEGRQPVVNLGLR